jgi:predicted nucleic acid-binding Zn ribbon protein
MKQTYYHHNNTRGEHCYVCGAYVPPGKGYPVVVYADGEAKEWGVVCKDNKRCYQRLSHIQWYLQHRQGKASR